MRVLVNLFAMAAMSVLFAACGGSNDDFDNLNLMQRTVKIDTAESLQLQSGGRLDIPAGTFDSNTVVIFANYFTGAESDFRSFPTSDPAAEDLLAGMVINTPVDAFFNNNITLQFRKVQVLGASQASAIQAGHSYEVYRFDFENAVWNQWGNTVAEAEAGAETAIATLPTAGMRGFIGSLAIFEGLESDGVEIQTTLSGIVVNINGDPVSTDVGLYLNIGGLRFPVAASNGRVPDVSNTDGTPADIANTVDSAADGTFTFELTDQLIGQLVSIDFGLEDTGYETQQRFNLLAPATPLSNVETMVIRFGENNVQSIALRPGG